MTYLQELYAKCKADGNFNKFQSYKAFTEYFKDDETYHKLYNFLNSKEYQVPAIEDFLIKVKEGESGENPTSGNQYLEKIFTKCKNDGHFIKFTTFEEFQNFFKDEATYKKLWEFLKSKDYKVVEFDQFLFKISGKKISSKTKESGLIIDIPLPAYGELCIP